MPFPPPGHLPDPGIEPASLVSPVLQADPLPLSHLGNLGAASVVGCLVIAFWLPWLLPLPLALDLLCPVKSNFQRSMLPPSQHLLLQEDCPPQSREE